MAEKEKSPSEQIKEIKDKALVKNKVFNLIYDSFGEGLEPSYYWILDFLREDLKYGVEKIHDQFMSAEASGFFGELGVRRTAMEKRAMELMQTLGVLVKSILQLLWDMKEFELRLDHYDKLNSKNKEEREAADSALRAIWLTDVDIKKGRGSINMLAQDLNFVTLRDAFMVVSSVEDVKKLDLNDRVKRILKYKIKEYMDWRKRSEAELRKRFQVEKAWLKSQVNAMNLYTKWARPYLIATKKLFPAEKLETGMEELVTAFDVMRIDLIIFGKSEVNKIPQPGGRAPKIIKVPDEDNKVYSVMEVEFRFRSTPTRASQGREASHYTHRGRTEMIFRPYMLTGAQIKKIKDLEEDEVLQFLEGMTTDSLDAMRDDLAKYVEEPTVDEVKKKLDKFKTKEEKIKYLERLKEATNVEVKKEVEKRLKTYKIELPLVKEIKGMLDPFKDFSESLKSLGKSFQKPKTDSWNTKRLKALAKTKAGADTWLIYKTYKDAHKMLKW